MKNLEIVKLIPEHIFGIIVYIIESVSYHPYLQRKSYLMKVHLIIKI